MLERQLKSQISTSLKNFPAVGLLGSRQTGKTTLAKSLVRGLSKSALYLDLELPSDLAKLKEPELYLDHYRQHVIIIDEMQRKPELFPLLRALIDKDRRKGRFLLLGSAAPELKRQASESLAGRIVYHELTPFLLSEIGTQDKDLNRLMLRGGYPDSFLAKNDLQSFAWREAFITTYLEKDVPQLGIRVPAQQLRRFWQMLAHAHGQIWNASKIAGSLGVSAPTVSHYIDILQDTFLTRTLSSYFANVKKRVIKSPKIYVRDSGLLLTLLQIHSRDELLGHPALGSVFEGFVVEQIIAALPTGWQAFYYRTSGGAEIDLVLFPPNKAPIAIEIKYSLEPKLSRGFWEGMTDLACRRGYVVYPGKEYYPVQKHTFALPITELARIVKD